MVRVSYVRTHLLGFQQFAWHRRRVTGMAELDNFMAIMLILGCMELNLWEQGSLGICHHQMLMMMIPLCIHCYGGIMIVVGGSRAWPMY
jgi:hypothetical protein